MNTFKVKIYNCVTVDDSCPCLTLSRVNTIKYLGVYLDSTLSWTKQIESLTSRARKLMSIFRKLRNAANPRTLTMIHFALAQCILCYYVPAWGGALCFPLSQAYRAERELS